MELICAKKDGNICVNWFVFKNLFKSVIDDTFIWDDFHDLVPFLQFKKSQKYWWRSVTFSRSWRLKPVTILKLAHLYWDFSSSFNCTNENNVAKCICKVSCKKVYPTLKANIQHFLSTKVIKYTQMEHLNVILIIIHFFH